MSNDPSSSIASTFSTDASPVLVRPPFDKLTITLHWTTLLFVLALLSSGLLHGQVEGKSWAAPLLRVHQSLGMTIWMLVTASQLTSYAKDCAVHRCSGGARVAYRHPHPESDSGPESST